MPLFERTRRPIQGRGRPLAEMGSPRRSIRPQPPAVKRTEQFITNAMRRDPRLGPAVRPFSRLEKMADQPPQKKGQLLDFFSGKRREPAILPPKKGKMFDFLRRRPRAPNETEREMRPLSLEERQKNPIILIGNETIHRNTLRQFKEMVVDERYGLRGTILQIAAQYPALAEILREPKMFEEFVEKQVPRIWRVRLLQFMKESPELRAVALLIYLQVAYTNDRKTRHAIRQMRREQRAA